MVAASIWARARGSRCCLPDTKGPGLDPRLQRGRPRGLRKPMGRPGHWARTRGPQTLSQPRDLGTPMAYTFPGSAAGLRPMRTPPWARPWGAWGPGQVGCSLPLHPMPHQCLQKAQQGAGSGNGSSWEEGSSWPVSGGAHRLEPLCCLFFSPSYSSPPCNGLVPRQLVPQPQVLEGPGGGGGGAVEGAGTSVCRREGEGPGGRGH